MKRSEIEAKAREQLLKLKAGIEVQPLKAVGVALFAGILLAVFAKLFISLLFIAAVAVVVLWLLADKDGTPLSGDGSQGFAGQSKEAKTD